MVAACFFPWVTSQSALVGSAQRNAFQLGSLGGEFSPDGAIGVFLGLVTVLLGLCRLKRAVKLVWLARSPLWPALGCGILLALDIPSLNHSDAEFNQVAATFGVVASLGLGVWVFAAGAVVAAASALLLRRTRLRVHPTALPTPGGLQRESMTTPLEELSRHDAERGVAWHAQSTSSSQTSERPTRSGSVVDEIDELSALRDSGILSEAEFQAKKTELLERLL
jgi:hypothetical protein